MSSTELRQELHEYIDNADDRLINLMYALVQADMKESNYQLTDEHMQVLDQRLKKHVENPDSGSNWKEAKARISSQL